MEYSHFVLKSHHLSSVKRLELVQKGGLGAIQVNSCYYYLASPGQKKIYLNFITWK